MFSLCVRQCLKVYVSRFKFELTAEKRVKSAKLDQELGPIDRESHKLDFVEFLNLAQAHEKI